MELNWSAIMASWLDIRGGVDIAAILGSNDVLVVWEFNLGDGFGILLAPVQNHDI